MAGSSPWPEGRRRTHPHVTAVEPHIRAPHAEDTTKADLAAVLAELRSLRQDVAELRAAGTATGDARSG
jgi:hypothetical protein